MIFLSDFLRADVVDLHQRRAGKVRDLAVRLDEPFPRVIAVVMRPRHGLPGTIDWGAVRTWDDGELSLNVPASELEEWTPPGGELWLARDILDRQIVDTDGRRLVRVNDLQLQTQDGHLLLVGVDVGARGVLRRANLEKAVRRLRRIGGGDLQQRIISWEAVDPIASDQQAVKLRVSHTKLAKMHPADIAEIVGQLGTRDQAAIFASLDDETSAEVLEETSDEERLHILNSLDDERAADILEEMAPDDAADLLADLPEERREQLISKMEAEDAEDVEELLAYQENSAGGLMTTEYVAVPASLTAQETIDRLRELEPDAESIYYVYVIDDEERLLGVLSLRDLIVAGPQTPIIDLMIQRVIAVQLDATPEDVAAAIHKYNLLAVPVVDEDDRIQGIVTVDDALEEVLPARLKRRARAL